MTSNGTSKTTAVFVDAVEEGLARLELGEQVFTVPAALLRAGVTPKFRQIALPDEFLDAGALPTLQDRYGISASAMAASIKGWL